MILLFHNRRIHFLTLILILTKSMTASATLSTMADCQYTGQPSFFECERQQFCYQIISCEEEIMAVESQGGGLFKYTDMVFCKKSLCNSHAIDCQQDESPETLRCIKSFTKGLLRQTGGPTVNFPLPKKTARIRVEQGKR